MWTDFTPKLITRLTEGYHLADLRADARAALTVSIVALPLSMAMAIASGVAPERGLYAAIVGGFLVSLLGGSRFQIGGPAGAFIVLIAGCVAQIGIAGLLLATLMSGGLLILIGLLRAGAIVQRVPQPVIMGFGAAIAVIIVISQIKDLTGMTLTQDPAAVGAKLTALWQARATLSPAALGLSAATIALILTVRRLGPRWPSLLIAVTIASLIGPFLSVQTIFDRFGDLPRHLPAPHLPAFGLAVQALPWAVEFALLGSIATLLSAMVADRMSGAHHRPNAELVAQGFANIGSALFGGICVTGAIARTATNVRAGARGPVAGMLHSVILLVFLMVAAPLAGHIPLAALAGVLALVAWDMIDKPAIWRLMRTDPGQALILTATFGLVVLRGLGWGIMIGCALSAMLHWLKSHK